MTLMTQYWSALAAHLRADMKRQGLTPEDIHERTGASVRSIQRLLSGRDHSRIPPTLWDVVNALDWAPERATYILDHGTLEGFTKAHVAGRFDRQSRVDPVENERAEDEVLRKIDVVRKELHGLPDAYAMEVVSQMMAEILERRRNKE